MHFDAKINLYANVHTQYGKYFQKTGKNNQMRYPIKTTKQKKAVAPSNHGFKKLGVVNNKPAFSPTNNINEIEKKNVLLKKNIYSNFNK